MQSIDDIGARSNLNDAAEVALRAMIFDGRLKAGERLNEVRLAQQMGLSRTPLREALNRLVAEGAVDARPRLGYFVKPLTLEEFEQIYDIRPILDPAALRLAGIPSAKQIAQLRAKNQALQAELDPEAAMAIDEAWHLELLAHCPNRVLVALIETMMRRCRRYELALMRSAPAVVSAQTDHTRILDALAAGDLETACAALRENMEGGKTAISAWLQTRDGREST